MTNCVLVSLTTYQIVSCSQTSVSLGCTIAIRIKDGREDTVTIAHLVLEYGDSNRLQYSCYAKSSRALCADRGADL